MEIYENDVTGIRRDENSVVTVGTFDGLHSGHKKLIEKVVRSGSPSTVVTFYPHPQMVVARPGVRIRLLTPPEEKVKGLAGLGVDRLIVLEFDSKMMNMSAEDFLQDIVIDKVGLKMMVVGYDHAFGRNRKGGKEFVVEKGRELGFQTEVVEPFYWKSDIVSSTLIRKTLLNGDVKLAGEYLGRPYSFSGWVIKGDARGATLGYPTANLKLNSAYKMLPLNGVYAVYARICERKYRALLYIGNRPTYGEGDLTIEAFLLDFEGGLYGEMITVELIERLRGDVRFDSQDELIVQMHADEKRGREILNHFKP